MATTGVLTSIIRTLVPYLVGLILAFGLKNNLSFDEGQVSGLVTFVIGTLYYILARLVETKYPDLGWLLGSPKQPAYPANPPVEPPAEDGPQVNPLA